MIISLVGNIEKWTPSAPAYTSRGQKCLYLAQQTCRRQPWRAPAFASMNRLWRSCAELARRQRQSVQTVLKQAIDSYRREKFLEEANTALAALRSNPDADSEERRERELWDQTIKPPRTDRCGMTLPKPSPGEIWFEPRSRPSGVNKPGAGQRLVVSVDTFNHGPADSCYGPICNHDLEGYSFSCVGVTTGGGRFRVPACATAGGTVGPQTKVAGEDCLRILMGL